MDTGSYMHVTVNGQLGNASSPWTNTWTLECTNASDFNALQNIGSYIVPAFLTAWYTPLAPLISLYSAVTSVLLREYGNPASGYDWSGLFTNGSSGGNPEPSFVTASMSLVRDNYSFKSGRKGIAGIAAGYGDTTGKMTTTYRTAFAAAASVWKDELEIEAGAADYTFVARIVHDPSNIHVVPATHSDIISVACHGFGSQNTRK